MRGSPVTEPQRLKSVLMKGSEGTQRSTIPRTIRGDSAAKVMAMATIMASRGSCPEWFGTSITRPAGTFSIPKVLTRKYFS